VFVEELVVVQDAGVLHEQPQETFALLIELDGAVDEVGFHFVHGLEFAAAPVEQTGGLFGVHKTLEVQVLLMVQPRHGGVRHVPHEPQTAAHQLQRLVRVHHLLPHVHQRLEVLEHLLEAQFDGVQVVFELTLALVLVEVQTRNVVELHQEVGCSQTLQRYFVGRPQIAGRRRKRFHAVAFVESVCLVVQQPVTDRIHLALATPADVESFAAHFYVDQAEFARIECQVA